MADLEDVVTVTPDSTILAGKDQVSTDLQGEAIVLGLDKGIYFGLDEVGAKIWEMLREPRRVSDLRDAIVSTYEVDPETCERDVIRFLESLEAQGLIEVTDEVGR
jgi:hypothetical protein